jgi:hypothetical protein
MESTVTPQEQYYSTRLGSVVGTPLLGFWQHVGILVPTGPQNRRRSVISFTEDGIIKQPVEEFAHGKALSSVAYLGNLPPLEVVRRAEWSIAHRPYHTTDLNCDFFVRHCHGVKQESPQAQTTVALALFGAFATFAALASR